MPLPVTEKEGNGKGNILYNQSYRGDRVLRIITITQTGVLNFMASNGLIANPSKTVFMILNNGKNEEEERLEIYS